MPSPKQKRVWTREIPASKELTNSSEHFLVNGVVVLLADEQVLENSDGLILVQCQNRSSHAVWITAGRECFALMLAGVLGLETLQPFDRWEVLLGRNLGTLLVVGNGSVDLVVVLGSRAADVVDVGCHDGGLYA